MCTMCTIFTYVYFFLFLFLTYGFCNDIFFMLSWYGCAFGTHVIVTVILVSTPVLNLIVLGGFSLVC